MPKNNCTLFGSGPTQCPALGPLGEPLGRDSRLADRRRRDRRSLGGRVRAVAARAAAASRRAAAALRRASGRGAALRRTTAPGGGASGRYARAGQQPFLPLVLVLDELDAQEAEAADERDGQQPDQPPPAAQLRGADRRGHREAAEDQHHRIQRPKRLREIQVGVDENLRMVGPINGIGAEQPGKQQDFRGQEEPDAELARIELLAGRLEVMRQVGSAALGRVWVVMAWFRGSNDEG